MVRSTGNPAWDLANRLKAGKPLVLTHQVRRVLQRAAREVGIDESTVEVALNSPNSARALLWRIRARWRNSSWRLMRALHRMYHLRDTGDLEGARQEMRDLLTRLIVPHHRRVAQGQLDQLDDWKPPKGKTPARKAAPPGKAPARKVSAGNQRHAGKRS